jgi:hypothetical protein
MSSNTEVPQEQTQEELPVRTAIEELEFLLGEAKKQVSPKGEYLKRCIDWLQVIAENDSFAKIVEATLKGKEELEAIIDIMAATEFFGPIQKEVDFICTHIAKERQSLDERIIASIVNMVEAIQSAPLHVHQQGTFIIYMCVTQRFVAEHTKPKISMP